MPATIKPAEERFEGMRKLFPTMDPGLLKLLLPLQDQIAEVLSSAAESPHNGAHQNFMVQYLYASEVFSSIMLSIAAVPMMDVSKQMEKEVTEVFAIQLLAGFFTALAGTALGRFADLGALNRIVKKALAVAIAQTLEEAQAESEARRK